MGDSDEVALASEVDGPASVNQGAEADKVLRGVAKGAGDLDVDLEVVNRDGGKSSNGQSVIAFL